MSSGVVSKPNASASGSTFLDVFLGCDDEDVAVAAAGGGGGLAVGEEMCNGGSLS